MGEVYDGTFTGALTSGDGLTAKALRDAGIRMLTATEVNHRGLCPCPTAYPARRLLRLPQESPAFAALLQALSARAGDENFPWLGYHSLLTLLPGGSMMMAQERQASIECTESASSPNWPEPL